MSYLVTKTVSHKFQVCSLYKRAIRAIEAWSIERDDFRRDAVKMRQRFEMYRHIKDMRVAKEILEQGEEELFQREHPFPLHSIAELICLGPDVEQGYAISNDFIVAISLPSAFLFFSSLDPLSPQGVAYGREQASPDWVLDYWHPLEKAQYPEYFAKRELRKKEYVENWEKQYGKPMPDAAHH